MSQCAVCEPGRCLHLGIKAVQKPEEFEVFPAGTDVLVRGGPLRGWVWIHDIHWPK